MKKALLIMTAFLLITVNGNCQWYQREYGVNDINQLSQQQLNESLNKATIKCLSGTAFSIIGVIGLVYGSALVKQSNELGGNAGEGKAYAASIVIMGSLAAEIVGLTKIFKYGPRIEAINNHLKNAELSLGITKYPFVNLSNSSDISPTPVISLSINF